MKGHFTWSWCKEFGFLPLEGWRDSSGIHEGEDAAADKAKKQDFEMRNQIYIQQEGLLHRNPHSVPVGSLDLAIHFKPLIICTYSAFLYWGK